MDRPPFALAHGGPLSVSTWTPIDTIKLKKNTSFALQQNRRNPIGDFQKAMLNVVEYRFDKHERCGEWCPMKKMER
jgi:hypothetical protein